MKVPSSIGPYRPLDVLGAGGMGVVYLAQHPDGRMLAIKVLNPGLLHRTDRAELLRRLRREAEIMQKIRSPRVAELVDLDLEGDQPFLATRLIEGRSLQFLVDEQGSQSGDGLRRLAVGMAEALAAIHTADCVHRDLKPNNVMVVDGDPVLIDFGIAHMVDATKLTQGPVRAGTLGYMAPEALEGRDCGPEVDVFAWAGTVVFAATGRPVFGTGALPAVLRRVLSGSADLRGLPAGLLPLIRQCLAADPAHRPRVTELLDRLTGRATAPAPLNLPQPRPGGDMMIEVVLAEGDPESRELKISTAVQCPECSGEGALPGPRLCGTCGGDGRVSGLRSVGIRTPKDLPDGQVLHFVGKGEAGVRRAAPGDLYVRLTGNVKSRGPLQAALRQAAFPTVRMKSGFDTAEVDSFLERVRKGLDGTGPQVNAREVLDTSFKRTRISPGYEAEAVMQFMDFLRRELAEVGLE